MKQKEGTIIISDEKKSTTEHVKQKQQLYIHIERWQNLVEMLDDKKKVFSLALIFLLIGLTLFWGISLLVVQLKASYTYSDITTNVWGTTTIKDEQKQVSYFLFNTAELWANSGIKVKKGDVISIHSSGRAHTAIHHLYDCAQQNRPCSDDFFDANGERVNPENNRDKLRSEYRIFPKLPQSALLMQVCETVNKDAIPLVPRDGNPDNFYYVGAHCDNIHINNDGTLFFAINDIVLDSLTIIKMKIHNLHYIAEKDSTLKSNINGLPQIEEVKPKNLMTIIEKLNNVENILNGNNLRSTYKKYMKDTTSFAFGGYETKDIKDSTFIKTEMDYYLEKKYKKAWYDDNVGSFLILVEKNNQE